MSTRTGINGGHPDSPTDMVCIWQLCTTYVSQRYHKLGLLLCQEHALFIWSVVDEQLHLGETFDHPETNPFRDEHPHPPETPFAGYVYYIRTGGRIKIGHSTDLGRRLGQYPPDVEVLYIQSGDRKLERREQVLHHAYLTDGREWFQDRPEVTNPIEAMADANPRWKTILDGDEWWRHRKARNTPKVG